jgi:hypothetical protein
MSHYPSGSATGALTWCDWVSGFLFAEPNHLPTVIRLPCHTKLLSHHVCLLRVGAGSEASADCSSPREQRQGRPTRSAVRCMLHPSVLSCLTPQCSKSPSNKGTILKVHLMWWNPALTKRNKLYLSPKELAAAQATQKRDRKQGLTLPFACLFQCMFVCSSIRSQQ